MNSYINKKVLITTSNWFTAPDGKQYKSVWGTLNGVHEASKQFGFIPNRAHANWFIEVGDMTIMGCQVMYITKTEEPNLGEVEEWFKDEKSGLVTISKRPTMIYVTT
jgi:hypothetical protein